MKDTRTEDVQEFFARVASDWDAMRLSYYDGRVIEKMAEVSGTDGTMTVADVGTGTGFVAAGIAPRVGRVLAVDNSPAMLDVARKNLAELGGQGRLEELLAQTPAAHIVRSMPGMGVVFTAEFLAEVGNLGRFASSDALAAAAGVTPVLRASGATSYRRRARRGNKVLKRLLYRSALSCISHHERSEAYYRKKRAEGKGHHQAVIALARRRVNVLWAMLRDGQTYSERSSQAA